MTRAAELGEGPAVDGNQLLVEGDTLIAPQQRPATFPAIAPTELGRHVGDLETARLPLADGAAEQRECFQKE